MGEHSVEQNLGCYFLIILLNCTLYYMFMSSVTETAWWQSCFPASKPSIITGFNWGKEREEKILQNSLHATARIKLRQDIWRSKSHESQFVTPFLVLYNWNVPVPLHLSKVHFRDVGYALFHSLWWIFWAAFSLSKGTASIFYFERSPQFICPWVTRKSFDHLCRDQVQWKTSKRPGRCEIQR